jgi:hypothetical protein
MERLRASLVADARRIGRISRGKLIAILIVLLIGLGAAYVLEPRIETSAGAPPDVTHAILTPLEVSNGGYFAFRDVHVQCVARAMEFEQASQPAAQVDNNVLHVTNVATPAIHPGQKFAVTCAKGLDNQPGALLHADVDLNVCLKPYPLIDYISLVHFRYVGDRAGDGRMRWVEQPPRRSSIPWMVIQNESDKLECQWAE